MVCNSINSWNHNWYEPGQEGKKRSKNAITSFEMNSSEIKRKSHPVNYGIVDMLRNRNARKKRISNMKKIFHSNTEINNPELFNLTYIKPIFYWFIDPQNLIEFQVDHIQIYKEIRYFWAIIWVRFIKSEIY